MATKTKDLKYYVENLQSKEGKVFMISGSNERILNVEFDSGKCRIKTDYKIHEVLQQDLPDFVEGMMPVEDSIKIAPKNFQNSLTVDKSTISLLKDTLMENIEKIKKDKEYIPQAQAINDQARSIIELAKSEIEFIKVTRSI